MNFEVGDVLTRARTITWKQKVLWIIGILFGLLMSVMFPLMFSPVLFPMLMRNSRMDVSSASVVMIGSLLLFLLFIVAFYPISILTQSLLTNGVLNAKEEAETLSAIDLVKRSLPFFWRVLGLMVLFGVAFIPFFAVATGISMIFSISAWVLTYLRLRRSLQRKPLSGTVEATT